MEPPLPHIPVSVAHLFFSCSLSLSLTLNAHKPLRTVYKKFIGS